MLLHRVSPTAQAEAIPEEVQPQVEGMEEEEEAAVQEAAEAKVRGAEERQLVSTVENADAATPLAAAATGATISTRLAGGVIQRTLQDTESSVLKK